MQINQLKAVIEAALLASSQPMTPHQLGDLFAETDEVGREQIAMALETLADDCAGRGIELKEVASGFRYQVRQDVHPWISRMWTERPSRYSRALLETLALIAYRQPITRPEIEQIRGVVVSSSIIKTMEEREWIRVVGYRDVPGKPALFGTTRAFLDYFNLKSLDQLPPLSEIRDMEDPQMRFEQEPLTVPPGRDLPIDPESDSDTDALSTISAVHVAGADNTALPLESDQALLPTDTNNPGALTAPSHAETPTTTADEAAKPADIEPDVALQDTKEYRA